jgi:hypothetical protein
MDPLEVAARVLRRQQLCRPGVLFVEGVPAPFVPLDREAELVPLAMAATRSSQLEEELAVARRRLEEMAQNLAASRRATAFLVRRLRLAGEHLDAYREAFHKAVSLKGDLEHRIEEARSVANAAIQDVQNGDRIIGALVRRQGIAVA